MFDKSNKNMLRDLKITFVYSGADIIDIKWDADCNYQFILDSPCINN